MSKNEHVKYTGKTNMMDDSLSDVVKERDGGYCHKCDTVWAAPGRCRCDPLLAKHETALNVYAKQIWNDAIEAAAKIASDYDGDGMDGGMDCHLGDAFQTRREITEQIRKLKK